MELLSDASQSDTTLLYCIAFVYSRATFHSTELLTMMFPALLLSLVTFFFVLVNFIYALVNGRTTTNKTLFTIIELWTILAVPAIFLAGFDLNQVNDCCTDSAVFSPGHRAGIYTLIILYSIAYLISILRKQVLPPVAELLLNMLLILGLGINILLCIHLATMELGFFFWFFGNIPIILLLLMKLTEHHRQLKAHIEENNIEVNNLPGRWALAILKLEPIYKYPVLLVLLIPIVISLSLFLVLFGQKPDSILRAFTDTYKHGFSQLDYMCDNVECGGHFLCSVGANGHRSIVKPVRYGERNGAKIICNRQLLISNAFEDLLQERCPAVHSAIRRQYNKVGNFIHRYYSVFNNKIVSDLVYLLMKPLEWVFLLVIYTLDKKPEDRIARQYLKAEHTQHINILC